MSAPPPDFGGRLNTARAAAVAGVVFAVLLGTSTVLLRLVVPPVDGDAGDWLDANRSRLSLALWLVPFAGIAFLWFIGVVRDRLGDREDRFFASVMFGSGLLYLAMLFAAASLSAALVGAYEAAPERMFESGGYEFAPEAVFALSNTFGVRMAGVFMLSTGTIWWRSGVVPRWLGGSTYALTVLQVFGPGISLWMTLVFPFWVLIVSVHFLVVRPESPRPTHSSCSSRRPRRRPWSHSSRRARTPRVGNASSRVSACCRLPVTRSSGGTEVSVSTVSSGTSSYVSCGMPRVQPISRRSMPAR